MSAQSIATELMPRKVTVEGVETPEDRHSLQREIVLFLGGETKANKSGEYQGYTMGSAIMDYCRQEFGRLPFDACAKLAFERGLIHSPPDKVGTDGQAKRVKVDAWRLTASGVEVYKAIKELMRVALEQANKAAAAGKDKPTKDKTKDKE